jgi:UDP-GlcNAc:undecaprenyl-phosphate/decaprenyl-phosphate GlcNAc-1-phosphate transferase
MTEFWNNPFVAAAASVALAAVLTVVVRFLARRYNFVAKPKADRWHTRPTAMLGGVAIFVSTIVMYAAFVPKTPASIIVLSGSSVLFIVGLVDDVLHIKPYQKLIGQLIGASLVVGTGLKMPLTGYELVDLWITVFWIIGITNAINLLDNMDGLAAGISAIAAISLGLSFGASGQPGELLLIAVFVGSLVGFLIFNFNPASIFMGDCGSMFVGFLLSTSVLLNQTGGRSRGIVPILAVPVLILFVPIFDTTFVTVLRKLWGRKASQGGRDHTSHRLVALGLSERSAVLMLYAFAAVAGGLSLLVSQVTLTQSLALVVFFTIVLVIIGVYLSQVKVYERTEEERAFQNNAVFAFLVDVSYKRRIFEVFLDALLVTLSYYVAYAILYGPIENTSNWSLFISTAPLLVILNLGSFLFVGVYRGLWRYTSIDDLITFAKGVVLGTVLSILSILLLYRFENFSRRVFVLDAVIMFIALVASRSAFRLIRHALPFKPAGEGRRVLIYGAGDGGEMILRELRNNFKWNYLPVAFLDDDPMKSNKVIHGLRVHDSNGSLLDLMQAENIQEVLISVRELPADKLEHLRSLCRDANIGLKRAQIRIEPVDFE